MAELRVCRVTKSYDGRTPAVRGVTLEVPDGRVTAILGPSGCGKSTLLRTIAGLEDVDDGEIFIAGRPVNGMEPKDRDVAMVFQSYALYPHMTVFENVAVSLRLRGISRPDIRCRVDEAAETLGIAGLLERRPSALSGGERQRVALARAIVRQPRLFLMDEPLSNLDAILREKTRGELKTLFKRIGATVVYVTHDQAEALTLADQVAVMRAGEIEQIGSPEEVYASPRTVFVAGFVGSPRMNLLPGKVVASDAETVGIRPEDVRIGAEGGFEMAIALREMIGSQTLLTLRNETMELRALVPSPWTPVPVVRVSLDRSRWHIFDREGRRTPR